MSKQNKVIDVTCGIYSTEYRLISHRDGNFSVKAPFVKWRGNTGVLAFETLSVPEKRKATVLKMFSQGVALNDFGNLTLDDCLAGY